MKNVVILGAGGHAKVIADIVIKSGDNLVGFLDDNLEFKNKEICFGKNVLGTTKEIMKYKDYYFIIGIGGNLVRKKISKENDLKLYTAIHPRAIISGDVKIGEGTVIMAGVVINPGTIIGKHCIINTCASLDHDNILEDYVHISPGAHLAGMVHIKECCWIGVGAIVKNNIVINKDNVIGAGAVVVKDIIESGKTYVGVPAKVLI